MKRGFVQTRARLGETDLHPGGAATSARLIAELGPPGRVLEIGAGAGGTATRLARAGWQVTASEPDPELRARIDRSLGIEVRSEPLEGLTGGPWDAILAESVLFALDPPRAFLRLRTLLRDGGRLAFTDMVWTEAAPPAEAARLHDETRAAFGIACASRERLTWQDWRSALRQAGFEVRYEERLGIGSPGGASRTTSSLRDRLTTLPDRLRHRLAARRLRSPPAWLESWACVAERV